MENNILGVILAGGKSRRMGQDKNLIKLDDKTLIEHAIIKVNKFFKKTIVVSNQEMNHISKYNLEIIPDCITGHQGPLVGILSAMMWTKKNNNDYSWLMSFPCDTPFFPEEIIKKFIQLSKENKSKLYFAGSKGKRHNIFGLWSLDLYDNLNNDILNSNVRKVDLWAEKNNVKKIDFDFKNFDPFLNINTKDDLKKAIEINKKLK